MVNTSLRKITNHKPDWLKIKLSISDNFKQVNYILKGLDLNTVCVEARCPNIYECWDAKTATIMILGETCTRSCGFCSVKTGKPGTVDTAEPVRVAEAIKKLDLRHVVITSVDRDDLKNDYGAQIWAETIHEIHNRVQNCNVEVLTPDFRGHIPSIQKVFDAKPEIYSHNVETVERISRKVRPQSDWDRSKKVLKISVKNELLTKTGLMVGLGETDEEVLSVMKNMADIGVKIFTIGQYLQPTKHHLPVDRYVHPEVFQYYKKEGLKFGFTVVESGPLVRSSYHAAEHADVINGAAI